ncbi:CAP domain-containing protein [Arthrobacter sp. HLT1-20]
MAAGVPLAPTPQVSGAAVVGSSLAANAGTWTAGTVLKYQWLLQGVAIPGATGPSLMVGPAYLGKAMSVTVTGTHPSYSTVPRISKATAAVVAGVLAAPVPTVSGTGAVGSKLFASPGAWTTLTVLNYQWLRSGTAIPGATASSLLLGPDDLNKSISVRVTGAKAGFTTVSMTSAGVVVAGVLLAPVPTVSGAAVVGSTLAALSGTWTAGTALKYQWLRSGVAIPGATGSSLMLGPADLGKVMTVTVTGSLAGYSTESRSSPASAVVVAGVLLAPLPGISGAASVGSTLTVSPGIWTPGAALTYQWLRSGTPIPGATGASFLLSQADTGKAMTVAVTGSLAGYATAIRTSAASALVTAPPPGVPSLSDPFVAESFKLVNDYRVKNNLKPLKWNPGVATWSQKWADHLRLDFASSSWNGTWHSWNFYTNYPAGWTGAGENVALNTSAKTMFDWWVNSPGHNANMLNPKFTDFGFGYAKYSGGSYAGLAMGVQNFAIY